MPLVAIHIPKIGQLSRKERDELKAFGQERGLRVYDDLKRLDRDFPEQMAQVRQRVQPADDDLLILAGWGGGRQARCPIGRRCSPAGNCACRSRKNITTVTNCSIPKSLSSFG